MTAKEIKAKFIRFFEERGHARIPNASLIPENDPTVLFTTAGMHPLVPYLLGESHPLGKRLVGVQRAIRTGDIEEVGDNRHNTFFEMLGNWSLGDYFKKEAIHFSFEFLTKELGLNPQHLYVTVFEGDADAPRDDESIHLWQSEFASAGIEANVGVRIYLYPKAQNWWGPAGETGPCGPDTEMFIDTATVGEGRPSPHDAARYGATCHPNCDCGRFIEIWNDVFMEYNRVKSSGSGAWSSERNSKRNSDPRPPTPDQYRYEPLTQRNVDTGMGVERVTYVLQGKETVFDTELFSTIFASFVPRLAKRDTRSERIIADHLKAATFLIADGVTPSNLDQGYVLRRLIRRAVRYGKLLGMADSFVRSPIEATIATYKEEYPYLTERHDDIVSVAVQEEKRFRGVLAQGLQRIAKLLAASEGRSDRVIDSKTVFELFSTYGFPVELTEEIAKERGYTIDREGFKAEFLHHQELSRQGAEKRFAGGLADHSQMSIRYHTATHLLHQALRTVLGDHVFQKGSNITPERLRFDFSHPVKLTAEELTRVEELVNEKVKEALPVKREIMSVAEAKRLGAIGLFEEKYGDEVSVYTIGREGEAPFSREFCGGPHVTNTNEVGTFRIVKEEALSAGVRRIKAVVE
ncbi:MAG: alanine--tRNA ligase [Parcubacteria group bacterium]|nr:alanine--tRNA ligase [Parcubacteria group bacterium]